jgi:hypothetical protein
MIPIKMMQSPSITMMIGLSYIGEDTIKSSPIDMMNSSHEPHLFILILSKKRKGIPFLY